VSFHFTVVPQIVSATLDELSERGVVNLEDDLQLLDIALSIARPLVESIKGGRQQPGPADF
jgi:hypothetical protein